MSKLYSRSSKIQLKKTRLESVCVLYNTFGDGEKRHGGAVADARGARRGGSDKCLGEVPVERRAEYVTDHAQSKQSQSNFQSRRVLRHTG